MPILYPTQNELHNLILPGDIRVLLTFSIVFEYRLECCLVIGLSLLLNIQWIKIT